MGMALRCEGGYRSDYSKSNRAAQAEANGLYPASVVAKHLGHGLTAQLIKKYVTRDEYHHTSSYYNTTDYFNENEVAVIFGLHEPDENDYDFEPDAKATAALASAKTTVPEAKVLTNQKVTWVEWSGSRKHPKATEMKAEGCTVSVKGNTATVTTPDGKSFQKRLTTNGFRFTC